MTLNPASQKQQTRLWTCTITHNLKCPYPRNKSNDRKSEQMEFGRDIQSWIRELQEQSRVTIELQRSQFNEIYVFSLDMWC